MTLLIPLIKSFVFDSPASAAKRFIFLSRAYLLFVLLSLMFNSLFSRTFTMVGLILVQISLIQIEIQLHVSLFLFLKIL